MTALKPAATGVEIQIRDVVQQVELMRTCGHHVRERDRARPLGAIVVAAHRMRRCDFVEPVQHLGTAYVAGMHDKIGTTQRVERLFPQQPVRVGDHADSFDRIAMQSRGA